MSASILSRDGVRLAVADTGGDGVPMVFQHGLCGDARQAAEAVPDATLLRLLTLECRGHGGSQAGDPAGFSLATFSDDVAAMIEARVGGPVVVGGVSMGAAIALRLAVVRPDLVSGLILVRPAWGLKPAPANMAPNAEVGRLLALHGRDEGREIFAGSETARRLEKQAPDNLASLLGFFDREPADVTAALLTRISADGPGVTEAAVRALAVPALVMGCDVDAVHPFALAGRLAGLIPGARLVRLRAKARDRAGHFHDLQAAVRTFLTPLREAI